MKKLILLTVGVIFCFTAVNAQLLENEAKVEALLAKMTLEEKIGQMNQYSGFFDATGPAPKDTDNKQKYEHIKTGMVGSMLNVRGAKQVREMQKLAVEGSRLGIPIIFGFDVIHGHKTISPIPLAEAASWDLAAIKQSAVTAAIEASAEGLNWTFAPMVDISRDARWGRVMEGAGEDPYLGCQIATARVTGFQGDDLSKENTIAACAKHFAGYGFIEAGKDYNKVDVGTSTLYNIILPPFKAAADAHVATFMNAFNELNGIPATGDKSLQRDILKGKWKYSGFVVSDWDSIGEMEEHGFAKDRKHAAEIAANAGSDMDMQSFAYHNYLKELVEEGKVDIKYVDDAARRILRVKYALGLFDDPYRYCDEAREKKMTGHADHNASALDMAKKSIVLLKNEKNLLPLAKSGKKITVIGTLADDKTSPLGNWRLAGDNETAVSLIEALNAREGNEITFVRGPKLLKKAPMFHEDAIVNTTDRTGFDEAVAAAKNAETVIMVLGEHGMQSGEGRSRANIDLPGLQQELLEAVMAVNSNVILVLSNGRPLAITWAAENVPAILETWQLGTQSGHAIAAVLYGDYNPSGKLPMTFPRSVGQVPIYYNYKSTGRPGPKSEVFWSRYTDETNAPLYPFGHGLSYTNFDYKNLKIDVKDKEVSVSVTVTNTGKVAGEEVTQLYLRDRVASVTRPVKELKGFEKFALKAGESKTVNFTLTEKEYGFFDNQGEFIIEEGDFDVMVGGSSAEGVTGKFTLK
ncbi:MAG: beta-glucosidase [Saprospiraceae bacterium]|jgi:beta-glucosidase